MRRQEQRNHLIRLVWTISLLCFVNWSCCFDNRSNNAESFLLPSRINRRMVTVVPIQEESFRPRISFTKRRRRRRRSGIFDSGGRRLEKPHSSSNNDNDGGIYANGTSSNNNNNKNKKIKKGAHFGGRARMKSQTTPKTPKSVSSTPPPKTNNFGCGSLIGLVLLLSILKSLLFGGGGGGGSYTYYESSYFESRIYDSSNGQIQTTRKESVRTNIPNVRRDIIRSVDSDDGRTSPLENGDNVFLK